MHAYYVKHHPDTIALPHWEVRRQAGNGRSDSEFFSGIWCETEDDAHATIARLIEADKRAEDETTAFLKEIGAL